MNPISVVGALVMTLSFLAYGIGSVTLERFKIVGSIVLIFFSLGLLFETSAIVLMYIGSDGKFGGMHSLVGVFAFLLMAVNTTWVWSVYVRKGIDANVNTALLHYTKTAYFIWVLAYLAGIVVLIWI
jgi:hypothetical protein